MRNVLNLKGFTFCLFILFLSNSFAQKTAIWFNHSMTTPYFDSRISEQGTIKNRFTVGFGLGFNIEHGLDKKKSKFFVEYGFQYKSVRQTYLFGNYQLVSNTGGLFIPVGFKYLLTLKDQHKFAFRLGLNNMIQLSTLTSGGGSDKTSYEINKKGGVFPLIKFGMGYHWGKKFRYEICLHANLGFIEIQDIKIIEGATEVSNQFKGNYFEIEFNWKLKKKKD